MNTDEADLCTSVLLTCKSLSGGQGYFHREDAKSAKKNDFKNFRSSRLRGGFLGLRLGWAALCSSVVSICAVSVVRAARIALRILRWTPRALRGSPRGAAPASPSCPTDR